jgi:hypothetical protein
MASPLKHACIMLFHSRSIMHPMTEGTHTAFLCESCPLHVWPRAEACWEVPLSGPLEVSVPRGPPPTAGDLPGSEVQTGSPHDAGCVVRIGVGTRGSLTACDLPVTRGPCCRGSGGHTRRQCGGEPRLRSSASASGVSEESLGGDQWGLRATRKPLTVQCRPSPRFGYAPTDRGGAVGTTGADTCSTRCFLTSMTYTSQTSVRRSR